MPTYDYQCSACDHEFEHFQSINDKPLRKCPVCGKLKLRRLFGTGAAVVFKGSGFYQTDYRSESYKKGAEAADKQSDSGNSESGGKSSSESSTAASATPKPKGTDSSNTSADKSSSSTKSDA